MQSQEFAEETMSKNDKFVDQAAENNVEPAKKSIRGKNQNLMETEDNEDTRRHGIYR